MAITTIGVKEQLQQNVKEWIKLDNEISQLKHETKERVSKQKLLTTNLVSLMKNNGIEGIDINGGALMYKKNKSKKPISGKTLLQSLKAYFKDDQNSELAEEISKHVLDSREETVRETIKRKHV